MGQRAGCRIEWDDLTATCEAARERGMPDRTHLQVYVGAGENPAPTYQMTSARPFRVSFSYGVASWTVKFPRWKVMGPTSNSQVSRASSGTKAICARDSSVPGGPLSRTSKITPSASWPNLALRSWYLPPIIALLPVRRRQVTSPPSRLALLLWAGTVS